MEGPKLKGGISSKDCGGFPFRHFQKSPFFQIFLKKELKRYWYFFFCRILSAYSLNYNFLKTDIFGNDMFDNSPKTVNGGRAYDTQMKNGWDGSSRHQNRSKN